MSIVLHIAQRYFQLETVVSFNSLGVLPLNLFEEPNRRHLFRMLNKDIKVEELQNKKVKIDVEAFRLLHFNEPVLFVL